MVLHDYAGHPGQVQLARALAHRGHSVEYQYCNSYTTGRGPVDLLPSDPQTFSIVSMGTRTEFARYSAGTRIRQEIGYGIQLARRLMDARPDVVVLSNVPLVAHAIVAVCLAAARIPMVFWHQDIYSVAIRVTAVRKFGRVGHVIGSAADNLERMIARLSSIVIPIDASFSDTLYRWGKTPENVLPIPNWGPVDEVTPRPKVNEWSARCGLADLPVLMYAGTLGLKHDPAVIVEVARELYRNCPRARFVVISEGRGREFLERALREQSIPNLVLLDFQPYAMLPDVLATGDALLVLLDPAASKFSVPSKALTYMCAGRPLVVATPAENAVARMVRRSGAGLVVEPTDAGGIAKAALLFLMDKEQQARAAEKAVRYARENFRIERLVVQFESACVKATSKPFVLRRHSGR